MTVEIMVFFTDEALILVGGLCHITVTHQTDMRGSYVERDMTYGPEDDTRPGLLSDRLRARIELELLDHWIGQVDGWGDELRAAAQNRKAGA